MTATKNEYLAVYKASYDYKAQGEDEISVEEDQFLFLLDNSDPDWSKVKVKPKTQDAEAPIGLVPASYIEPATPIANVKALYDYDANDEDELSIKEDQVLYLFIKEDDWSLVQIQNTTGDPFIGYVPSTYIEEDGEEEEQEVPQAAAVAAAVVVPDSPPRAPYVDPAERVVQTPAKLKQDTVKTWPVSQVDAKGKKKKGTLGVGNGSIFFASESDKTPVQQWKSSGVTSVTVDKSKHIHIEIGGPTGETLNFVCKDSIEDIASKIESSRSLANGAESEGERPSTDSPPRASEKLPLSLGTPAKSPEPKVVRWASSPASEIPPRTPSPDQEGEGTMGVALYDFQGDAADELSIKEDEVLLVIDRSNEDWWRCRNQKGQEGVVPAQYIDLDQDDNMAQPGDDDDDREAREEQERQAELERQRDADRKAALAKERKLRQEQEKRAREEKEEKARAAEQERLAIERRKAEELKAKAQAATLKKRQEEKERAAREKAKEQQRLAQQKKKQESDEESDDDPITQVIDQRNLEKLKNADDKRAGKSPTTPRAGPPPTPGNTRIWHDRTGQFRVEAEFKGFENGKIRLHKLNGIIIEVPSEKMSQEDMDYIASYTGKDVGSSKSRPHKKTSSRSEVARQDSDDIPLALQRNGQASSSRPNPPPKRATDWFDFFLTAGCDIDDCTRYATAFEKDKMDRSLLPDMKPETLRTLGLREGDILRVMKTIEAKVWREKLRPDDVAQIRADEEYAKQVQDALYRGKQPPPPPGPIPVPKSSSPAPNLFTGPNGTLKDNTRRGRPTPATAVRSTSINVDEDILGTASDQLTRGASPMIPSSPAVAERPSSAAATQKPSLTVTSGFENDAWTVRPSSAKPQSPAIAVTPPVPSASAPPAPAPPPAPPAPPQPQPPVTVAAPAPAPVAPTPVDPTQELLQRIAQMRPPSAPVQSTTPQVVATPPVMSPMSAGTPMYQPSVTPTINVNAPRGPFAPVPANEVLLKPLVPTQTGFSGFIPTRPVSAGPSPTTNFIQRPFITNTPTGMMQPAMTGYNPGLMPQQTGYMMSQPTGMMMGQQSLLPQATGMYGMGGMGGMNGMNGMGGMNQLNTNIPPVPPLPSNFGGLPALSPAPSAFNSQPPSAASNNHSPANVFAAMKGGSFEANNQNSGDKYDALRPAASPLMSQPTGWVPSQFQPTYNGGYR